MASTETKSKPLSARRNTFQRMLDLEQRNKVNRMQASSTSLLSHTSTDLGRDSSSNPDLHPATLQTTGRAMTTPALSLSIPSTKPSNNGVTTKYVIKAGGEVIPQEEEVTEDDSDVSSICQSPGWDDYTGKKRKKIKEEAKERRRREKGLVDVDVKQAQKNRLSKAPPASKGVSKLAVSTDHTASAPAVPILPAVLVPEVKAEAKDIPDRVRRGSMEIGLKSFMAATQAIPVPWKSSQNAPNQTSPAEATRSRKSFSKTPAVFDAGGFIGGLKLRQAEEASAQDIIRKHKTRGGEDTEGLLNSDRDPTPRTGNHSSSTSITESIRPATSIYEESIRSPQQWDSLYAQAAALARGTDITTHGEDTTPIMERNIRKGRRSHPPTSRYFSLENEDPRLSQCDSPNASTRNSANSGPRNSEDPGRRPSSVISSDPPSVSGRGTSAERQEATEHTRGRASSNYVQHQRQQSESRAINGSQDEHTISGATTSSKSRRSSIISFARSRSRARNSNHDAPSSSSPRTRDGNTADKEGDKPNPFLSEDYVLTQLRLGLSIPAGAGTSDHRSSFSKSGPALKGLKNAAKNAFSRHSAAAPGSPTENVTSAVEFQAPMSHRPREANRAATIDVVGANGAPLAKAERILKTTISSPIVQDFAIPPSIPDRAASRTPNRVSKETGKNKGRKSKNSTPTANGANRHPPHPRTAVDLSEGSSTLDEYSNITTPLTSRPHSQKDDFSVTWGPYQKIEAAGNKTTSSLDKLHMPTMTGAIPFDDAASARNSWCQTALPIELTEDEDRMKTPKGKKSIPDFTTLQQTQPLSPEDLKPPTNLTDLHRKHSLSRSISTPEMQDLSFLPPLKHQALTRPLKEKRKVSSGKKGKQAAKSPEESTSRSLTRPPHIPIPTTKSEGSSPTSPLSSQYLQNARLNMPRAPRSPKGVFSPKAQNGGPEPIAKMFVVCCSCKYFHDMPSKIYECMAKPDNVVTDEKLGVSGVISTSVKCPWCGHGMTTACCAGYAAVVYLREKFH